MPILVHPRLTDFHGIAKSQRELDFAVPFFDQDIPLYVDPFLLWRSPSQQEQALHSAFIDAFKSICAQGKSPALIEASECTEVGLGNSVSRRGKRISESLASEIVAMVNSLSSKTSKGLRHVEELSFLVAGIAKDRISDFTCNFLKSFLIDYTVDQCEKLSIPLVRTTVPGVFDYRTGKFKPENVFVPQHPELKTPIVLVPKRWLRMSPWLDFDEYFRDHCPKDDSVNAQPRELERVRVLNYNRENFNALDEYIGKKELTAADCKNDPLFTALPVTSAKMKLKELATIPSGNDSKNDKRFEDLSAQLITSTLYPHLDFAAVQSRVDSGATIRDLVFFNNRDTPFTLELYEKYFASQIVFEMKNVKSLEREHVNQLNRYLGDSFGRFGVFVTRNKVPTSIQRHLIDLWSGQRKIILTLTDYELGLMVGLFEGNQRHPLDVLKAKYAEFMRLCPT